MSNNNEYDVNIRMDWVNLTVIDHYNSTDVGVAHTIISIPRDPSERNKSSTYDVERGFLDYIGEFRFLHKTYKVKLAYISDPIFVEFTPTFVRVGTRGYYKAHPTSGEIS